ncbi:MAG: hypothetical protein JW966_14745 [Anaerolineae bacterium]|nr:hypothetical protein [Anaerolineae bacterium]
MRLPRRSRLKSSRGHVRIEQGPHWYRRLVWGVSAITLIVVAGIVIVQFVMPALDDDVESFGHNRTWLEFAWTTTAVNQDAIRQLGQRLETNKIDVVYVEASAWRTDNSLLEGQYAAEFADALRAAYPELNVLLWLRVSGQQIAEPELRSSMIELSRKAVREWGYDGVQLNSRTIYNGDDNYIQLLRDLRAAVGDGALLSVTVPPDRIPSDPDVPMGTGADPALTWTVGFKQRVGLLLIDEIVVMAHASGLTDEETYATWVAYQLESYVTALADLDQIPDVIVALPTYDSAPDYDPEVENVRSAVRGVRQGLERLDEARDHVKGVGLYEYKTTDSLEWAQYAQYWLGLEPE